MKTFCFGLLLIGLITQSMAQVTKTDTLPEVLVSAANYKYLNSVSPEEVADISVKTLEEKVAAFDLESAEFYQDGYDLYSVTFYIPEGKILAAYDKDGKILRTIERYKDIKLPSNIREAVAKKYPGWSFTKDLYAVDYHETWGVTKKIYKIKLKNENQVLRIKIDGDGNFL